MALNRSFDVPDLSDRFGIAQDAPVPEDIEARQAVQIGIRAKICDVAKDLGEKVEGGRELSLALTHLEEALLWAGKAIFK